MRELGGRIAVLSPHLDDAALSLGATIARATWSGARVKVVTVFANDPDSLAPPGAWDARCGFKTAGEAAAQRRHEDARACALLGATPLWLPYADAEYERDVGDDALWESVAEAVDGSETVLSPGFPLAVADHARLTRLLLSRPIPGSRLALYVEQPYATWRLIGRGQRTGAAGLTPRQGIENLLRIMVRTRAGRRLQTPPSELPLGGHTRVEWLSAGLRARDWWTKQRAIRAYRSQVRGFGPLVVSRMFVYELGWGGEAIAWLPSA